MRAHSTHLNLWLFTVFVLCGSQIAERVAESTFACQLVAHSHNTIHWVLFTTQVEFVCHIPYVGKSWFGMCVCCWLAGVRFVEWMVFKYTEWMNSMQHRWVKWTSVTEESGGIWCYFHIAMHTHTHTIHSHNARLQDSHDTTTPNSRTKNMLLKH